MRLLSTIRTDERLFTSPAATMQSMKITITITMKKFGLKSVYATKSVEYNLRISINCSLIVSKSELFDCDYLLSSHK